MDVNFPHLNLKLNVDNTRHILSGLIDYRYDLGIIEGHCDDERIERQLWCKDELVIVASAQHSYAQRETTSLTQLSMAHWVLREKGAGTREIFDSCIHDHLEQLKVHREYDQLNVLMEMVVQGQYLTCLSRRSVQPWVNAEKVKILNVKELQMTRELSFAWRKQEEESPCRDAVIRTAKAITDALIQKS